MAAVPTVSVIIVCKNPGPALHAAVASVWAQPEAAVELVVVDGASTDGSREWLEANRSRIATVISEPDAGVYDAMNRGVSAAAGEWVLFLGADDRLANPAVVTQAVDRLRAAKDGVLAGEAVYGDGRIYRLNGRPNPLARNFVHHQAAFYRRSLFARHGSYDRSLAVMGDYDFNLRLWKAQVSFTSIDLRVAQCGVGGISDRGAWRGYREEIAVRHRHFPAWRCLPWDAISLARYLRKQLVHRPRRSPAGAGSLPRADDSGQ